MHVNTKFCNIFKVKRKKENGKQKKNVSVRITDLASATLALQPAFPVHSFDYLYVQKTITFVERFYLSREKYSIGSSKDFYTVFYLTCIRD